MLSGNQVRVTIRRGGRSAERNAMTRKGSGFTLVEMLVAMALSLIIILAVTQVFRLIGDNVLAGRAMQEMSSHLRTASDQMQRDLSGATVPARPWPEPGANLGYMEVYEGPFWDLGLGPNAAGTPGVPRTIPFYSESPTGDIDDVLMFTARAIDAPFVGQVLASVDYTSDPNHLRLFIDPANPDHRETLESQTAEIVWFTRFNDYNGNGQPNAGELTLHRRVFLVLPNLDLSHPTIQALSPLQFFSGFDLSVRTTQGGPNIWGRLANTLEDLTRRENRIAHDVSGANPLLVTPNRPFPNLFWRGLMVPHGSAPTPGPDGDWGVAGVDDDGNGVTDDVAEAGHFGSDDLTLPLDVAGAPMPPSLPSLAAYSETFGSDLMLANLLAFDVKVYDPTVTLQRAVSGSDAVLPGDPGYRNSGVAAADLLGQGGYVDLNYRRYTGVPFNYSTFSNPPLPRSGLSIFQPVFWGQPFLACLPASWDSWSTTYETDSIDQDGNSIVDQGTNGIDDNAANGVDDVGERETTPPYPVPLRGIQVRLRIMDRDTRQVRQMTVSSDFIPE